MAEENRFIRTHIEVFGGIFNKEGLNGTEIWVDSRTEVNYLFHYLGNAAGLTVLLDQDGKPVISPLPVEEKD